jgi:hypothetical protein
MRRSKTWGVLDLGDDCLNSVDSRFNVIQSLGQTVEKEEVELIKKTPESYGSPYACVRIGGADWVRSVGRETADGYRHTHFAKFAWYSLT